MVRDTSRHRAQATPAGRATTTASAIIGATAVALTAMPAAPAEPAAPLRLLPEYVADSAETSAFGAISSTGGLARGKSLINVAAFEAASATKKQTAKTHKVVAGDTVWALSFTYKTTVANLISLNGLSNSALIRVGQVLNVNGPASAPKKPAANAPATTAPSTSAATHTVRAGQTVSGIAASHNTTVSAIAAANSLANVHMIRVGQKLAIPGTTAKAPATPKPATPKPSTPKPVTPKAPAPSTSKVGTHKVVSGDTVWALSVRYRTTVPAIISANGLSSAAVIRVGQLLTISGASGPASAGTSTGSAPGTSSTPSNACQNLVPSTFLHYTYPDAVVKAANENKCTLNAMSVPSRTSMQNLVRSTAISMGVNPALAQAVAFQESGFNHRSVSPANAIGTMQVIPSSGEWAGQLLGQKINLLDSNDNVSAGVAILRSLQRTFPDNLDHAIGSYYQGAGSVKKYGLASDTKSYVAAIKAHMTRFS